MMKAVILSVFFFATLALADISYTGYISQANTTFLPNSYGPCTTGTSAYYYNAFSGTFATAGVRAIQVLGAVSYVAVYTGSFTPSTPCVNAIQTYATGSYYISGINDNSPVLSITGAYYLAAGTYTFVLFSSSGADNTGFTTSNAFGVKVIEPTGVNVTTASSPTWQQPYYSSGSTIVYTTLAGYVSYTYVPTTTGFFDIGAFAHNSSSVYSTEVSLGFFPGFVNSTQIYQSFTNFSATAYNYFPYNNGDHNGVWVYGIPLTAGVPVTLVASNYQGETSNYGFFVTPTVAALFTSSVWTQPEHGSAPTTNGGSLPACTVTTDHSNTPYIAKAYAVSGNLFLAESSDSVNVNSYMPNQINGLDFSTFLYRGTNVNPPTACPITSTYVGYVDSGVVFDPNAQAGTHTVVTSSYYNGPTLTANSGAVVYVFAGPTLNGAAVTAATTTTSSPSGGNSTTQAPSGGNTTTTTQKPATSSNPTTSTTNSASTVFASVAVAVIAAFALLF